MPASIKLQGVINSAATAADIAHLDQWFRSNGGVLTSTGRRTFSAQLDAPSFERIFGPVPPQTSGFAASVNAATELRIPEPLQGIADLLTLVPKQLRF